MYYMLDANLNGTFSLDSGEKFSMEGYGVGSREGASNNLQREWPI